MRSVMQHMVAKHGTKDFPPQAANLPVWCVLVLTVHIYKHYQSDWAGTRSIHKHTQTLTHRASSHLKIVCHFIQVGIRLTEAAQLLWYTLHKAAITAHWSERDLHTLCSRVAHFRHMLALPALGPVNLRGLLGQGGRATFVRCSLHEQTRCIVVAVGHACCVHLVSRSALSHWQEASLLPELVLCHGHGTMTSPMLLCRQVTFEIGCAATYASSPTDCSCCCCCCCCCGCCSWWNTLAC